MLQETTPAAIVFAAWLLFGGSHLLLAAPPLRGLLVRRLGERGFSLAYTAVAAATLTLLAIAVARHGGEGAAGSGLAALPAARWTLAALAWLGAALAVAGLANYFRSPIAFLRRRDTPPASLRPPATVERITRHPFFIGIAIVMGAHALLAPTLASAVYFAGFVVLVLAGIPLQDRKLRARYGAVYAGYEAATSALPFGAGAPPTPHWREFLVPAIGATLLAALHPLWQLGHGAAFALAVAAGGLYAVARQFTLAAAPGR